jgi:hypothetical protein
MAKGGRRPGAGRKKGVTGKKNAEILAIIQDRFPDYHPLLAMAEIANDESVDQSMRFMAHKEVAQYVAPKLKAIEHSGGVDVTPKVSLILNGA